MNAIRTCTRLCEAETVQLRQLVATDGAAHPWLSEVQGSLGAWVVEAKYDAGAGEVQIDVHDLLREIARTNPRLLIEALQVADEIPSHF